MDDRGRRAALRSACREQLAVLSSASAVRQYERDVPHVHVPSELVAGWFDDLAIDAGWPTWAFSESESDKLATFSATFERHTADFEGAPDVCTLLDSESWRWVRQAAADAIKELGW